MSGAYKIVDEFERTIAEYAGAKYGVAVDSCCNAIFISAVYERLCDGGSPKTYVLPKRTYPGVASALINAGNKVMFRDFEWRSGYIFGSIMDGALMFKRNMYRGGYLCLSFHLKKHLPIGRGGMILTDDFHAYEWFKKARFDGRNAVPLSEDKIEMTGWNCYLTPEMAARGLMLFDLVKDKDLPDIDSKTQSYPDLSLIKAYQTGG